MSAYLPWLTTLLGGYVTGTVKLALLGRDSGGALYAQDPVTHHYWSDVSSHEVSGTGYTPGGQAVTGLAVTQDDADQRVTIDFDDVDFGTLTLSPDSICAAVLYLDTGTPATSVLLGADVFGDTPTAGTAFTYVVSTEGFITVGV